MAVALPYAFGSFSFDNELWIHNGDLLDNPQFVEMEMVSAGPFRLEVYDAANGLVRSYPRPNPHGGWHTFSFANEAPVPAGDHELKLVNDASGTATGKSGRVETR